MQENKQLFVHILHLTRTMPVHYENDPKIKTRIDNIINEILDLNKTNTEREKDEKK